MSDTDTMSISILENRISSAINELNSMEGVTNYEFNTVYLRLHQAMELIKIYKQNERENEKEEIKL